MWNKIRNKNAWSWTKRSVLNPRFFKSCHPNKYIIVVYREVPFQFVEEYDIYDIFTSAEPIHSEYGYRW